MSTCACSMILVLIACLPTQEPEARPRAYWEAIQADGYTLPEGESAYGLIVGLRNAKNFLRALYVDLSTGAERFDRQQAWRERVHAALVPQR